MLSVGLAAFLLLSLLTLTYIHKTQAAFYEQNFTDYHKCEGMHFSRSERVPKTFYEIPDSGRNEDYTVDFHFFVLASSDAHIIFSTVSNPTKDTPVYEIVLGAGGNSFSDIRRKQKADVRATIKTKNILDALEVKGFWVHIAKDGLVEVGLEGKELAFLSWRDMVPLDIKYFSFCTWTGIEAKWYFNCPLQNNDTLNATEVEPVLTELERLRKDLLTSYNPYSRPVYDADTTNPVSLKLESIVVDLNEKESLLNIQGFAKLEWTDEKLVWDPEDYGGLANLHFVTREIWKPDIRILNSADVNEELFQSKLMTVSSKGQVSWKASFNTDVFCDLNSFEKWPSDIHNCVLQFAFHKEKSVQNLQLVQWEKPTQIVKAWKILTITASKPKRLNSQFKNSTKALPEMNMKITLQRYSHVYKAIFFAPFIVIAFVQLATFVVPAESSFKIGLGCLQLILLTIVITALIQFAPSPAVSPPYVVQLYSYSYVGVSIAMALSVLVINLSRNKETLCKMPRCLQHALTSPILQKIFLLPDIKMGKQYGKIQSYSPGTTLWSQFGILIDRISLIIYFALISYAIAIYY